MSMRQFRRAVRAVNGKALAYQIRDGYGSALAPLLERIGRGERVPEAELAEMMGPVAHEDGDEPHLQHVRIAAGPMVIPGGKGGKGVALLSVRGTAMYDLEFQPYAFSTLLLAQTMNALANDPDIGTIVLDIDSPGGMVTGTPEAGDAIFAAREQKRVIALVNPLAASAAYWIASQASEIVAVPTADVGSIGVFWLHVECSGMLANEGIKPTFIFAGEHKVEGNSFEPLSDAAREFQQREVDLIYRDFVKMVARGRGVSVAEVEKNFGQGRTFMAPEAKRLGMIDRVATVDAALARYGISSGMDSRRRGRNSEQAAEVTADAALDELGAAEPVGAETIARAFEAVYGDDIAKIDGAPAAETAAPNRRRRIELLRRA